MSAKTQRLKQRADGRDACRYNDQWFYGETEDEALEAREDYKARERLQIAREAKGTTVYTYAFSWLPVHKASVAKNTYNSYAGYLNRLVDKLGDLPMKDVTPSDIKAVYNSFLGQSESSIRKAKMLYNDLWDGAIEDGIVLTNPCRAKSAQPHHGTEGSHRSLTPEEDSLILSFDDPLRLAVLTMRYAGLRRGEVIALDIDRDVDFGAGVINVREAVHFEGNKAIIGDTKTSAGVREVPLFSVLRRELEGHHGLLTPSRGGVVMSQSAWDNAWTGYINRLERKINGHQKGWRGRTREHKRLIAEGKPLPPWRDISIRPHDLRHSYCTMLRDAGVDMKLAIRWMGHEDEKMILRIYDHVTKTRINAAIANVEARLQNLTTVLTTD